MLLIAPAALGAAERDTLQRYARDTWASFTAMTDEQSGLPADSLGADGTRSVQTSTTNIGAYMSATPWAATSCATRSRRPTSSAPSAA
jgi:hypothetical protein